MFSWERGYGDFVLRPDLETLRPVPWQEGTVVCLADVVWEDGSDVVASPRQVLRRQLARLSERGWSANAGTELEFIVFRDTYEQAWHKGYRELEPANLYNVDYSLLGTARVEPLIRRIRNSMEAAGMLCEDSKGECNFGQHEINFHYADALRTADEHAIYKNGVKEIAALEGMAITFMAKYDEREGNSCHIHFSLADDEGPLFDRDRPLFESFLAGQLAAPARADAAARAQHQLLQALRRRQLRADGGRVGPRQPHLLAARGRQGRLAALREPRRRRRPEPVHGAERDHRRRAARRRCRVSSSSRCSRATRTPSTEKPRIPGSLRDARELFAASEIARAAFGDEVVDHYVNAADVELAAFGGAVTDWERYRGFERL